jgi:predicted O-methyltransferase YrrM
VSRKGFQVTTGEQGAAKEEPKTSEEVAEEILRLLQRHGVVYVNRVLFEGKSSAELAAIKERIRRVIDKNMC